MSDQALVGSSALDRARGGDEQAFRELTDPHRRELHVHCYRMLGSLVDAEDVLQETLLAAWKGLDGYAERATFRAWLYRIATNRCLNAIRDAKRRRPAEPVPPFDPPVPTRRGEVTWLQPYPDAWLEHAAEQAPEARYLARETVELAFIAALQRLPPRQAAALLLRDVLDFSAGEVAAMLGTTTVALKGTLQRARASRDETRAGAVHRPAAEAEQELARRFAAAFTADDIDGVVELLTDDAWLRMPPAPHEYQGRDAIAAFLRTSVDWRPGRRLQLVPTRANGQPGWGCYLTAAGSTSGSAAGIIVITARGNRIEAITRFLDVGLFRPFALPSTLAGS